MSELSLNQISALELNSAEIGANLNDRLSKIDNNFAKIIQSDYLRGKSGSNFGTKQFYFSKNGLSSDIEATQNNFYNPVIKAGYADYQLMTNDYVVSRIKDAILTHHFNTTSSSNWPTAGYGGALASVTDKDGNIVNWYDNLEEVNSIVFIVEESNGKILVQSSLAYIFIDKRFTCITDANKNQYQNLVDLSCVIYYSIKAIEVIGPGSQGGTFYTVKSFPTIEYDATSGNFYWKIYGANSGLIAQGPKGDSVSNALAFCTYKGDAVTEENNKYVTISKVLVTYTDESGNNITSFVDIKEALNKNYINFDVVKDELNHIKLCAFCVPDVISQNGDENNENQQIIAGTICYTGDITQGIDGDYIVRFNENLAFNHLFNQRNFFSTMLRNSHNGDVTNLINGYGMLFIPMDSCGESGDEPTAAHTLLPGYCYVKNDDSLDVSEVANVLNVIPIKDINDSDVRKHLANKNEPNLLFTQNINDVLMADCPMNVHYDVRMINNPIRFKTSKLNIKHGQDESATTTSLDVNYNILNENKAQFDIVYKPDGERIDNYGDITTDMSPTLDIEYVWDSNDIIDEQTYGQLKVKPKLGLNGVALFLKHKNSLNQSVLDFIKDGVNDVSDNRDGNVSGNHYLQYITQESAVSNDYKNMFYLIKNIGCTGLDTESVTVFNYNVNTPYCNYTSIIPTYNSDNNFSIMMRGIKKDAPISEAMANIYYYGVIYPQKRKHTVNASGNSRSYDVISLYANDQDGVMTSDSASVYINDPSAHPYEYKCPVFSLYRDYRTSYMLIASKKSQTNTNSYEYNKTPINALSSHPLDYKDNSSIGNNNNIVSHEGTVYPHKVLLTDSANNNDIPSASGQILGHIIDRASNNNEQNFENYGTVIARIESPSIIDENSIILNESYLAKDDWDFKIKFNDNKLIAPIINIRSNAIASPGADFMRLRAWGNGGTWYAAYNIINTCLSINQAKHSLSYRFTYQYKNSSDELYKGRTNKQRLSRIITQDIQTGICGNMNNNFIKNKEIIPNSPMVGHLCDPDLMVRAGYPISTVDPNNILTERPNTYKGLGGKTNGAYGANAGDGDHLPISTTSLINNLSSRSNPHVFIKYYPHNSMCTPIDTMYNIGEYNITYNNTNYRGNDGYRTITLPYKPDPEYVIKLNKAVIDSIKNSILKGNADVEKIPVESRLVGGNGSVSNTSIKELRITGVEIIYNCEVLFDTLLDVVSGVAQRYNDFSAGTNAAWKRPDGLNLRICDAISHSKFIKHNISSQIGESYPSNGDSDNCNLSNFKLGQGVEEYYSGYRNQIDWIGNTDDSWKIIGSGYYYATQYDLDSYYNRAFMNPYYLYSPTNNTPSKYNFTTTGNSGTPYLNNGQYIYPKGSKRHLFKLVGGNTGDVDKINAVNNVTENHPPYFMGVGLIDCSGTDITKNYLGHNNKGIVYLCHKDDKAYNDVYTDANKKFNQIYLRNDVSGRDRNPSKYSPFVQTYINGTGDKEFGNAANTIALWYPLSTDIFNNPFMYNNAKVANISEKGSIYVTKPNYCTNSTNNNQIHLSPNFNLDNIKLAYRKCNINTNSSGYYTGHSINYGEFDNCKLEMLNIDTDGAKYTSDINATKFIDTIGASIAINYKVDETVSNNFKQNNTVSANICNDGVVWKDDSSNYVAIHMTGNVDDYQNISINKEISKNDGSGAVETVSLAGANGLPQTHMYISKNGSKAIYKVDFTKLLLAAGRLCETFGISDGKKSLDLITDSNLDDLIAEREENNQ